VHRRPNISFKWPLIASKIAQFARGLRAEQRSR
jgi:hypothetical protein